MSDVFGVTATVRQVVQDRLAAEASARSEAGDAPLSDAAAEALAMRALRDELARLDQSRLGTDTARLSTAQEDQLIAEVMASAVGLGPFDLLLADPTLEDVAANRFDVLYSYHSDGSCRRRSERFWSSEQELTQFLSHIARTRGRTERQFNAQHPLLTMRIGAGLRLAAQRDVSEHVSFTLRRNTLGSVSLDDLVRRGMFSPVLAELFAAMGEAPEMRVAFGGATGAGKTTLVRAILNGADPSRRLVVCEDTAELDLWDDVAHPNVLSWEVREPNSEGEGEVGLAPLVKQGLRNRPDLLIVGEVRGPDAAVPMLEAMTHGQASMTTVHADDAQGVLSKLALHLGKGADAMSLAVAHHNLAQALDFVVHVDRGVDGGRFVSQVLEIAGFDGAMVTTNLIYEASSPGAGRTMHRMSESHARKLRRAGFDANRLGGGWS